MKSMESGAPAPHRTVATAGLRFSQLSAPRKALVRLCQRINHGAIQGHCVRNGEPVFSPPPVVLVDVKLDSDDAPRLELDLPDFELCGQVCRLMRELHALGTGMIEHIEVRGGIPRRIVFRGSLTKASLPQTALPDQPASEDIGSQSGVLL
jgi:hypothetical protein